MHLHWSGSYEYSQATSSFHGEPVAVPGDVIHREEGITNCGPCSGTLTVSLVGAKADVAGGTVNHADDPFDQMSLIRWTLAGQSGTIRFTDLAWRSQYDLVTIPLGKNQTEQLSLIYEFPKSITTGKNQGQASKILTYDVQVTLQGGDCPEARGDARGALPFTGSNLLLPGLVALAALLIGALLLAARHRRKDKP